MATDNPPASAANPERHVCQTVCDLVHTRVSFLATRRCPKKIFADDCAADVGAASNGLEVVLPFARIASVFAH
jgi:hypothetical protein